MFKRILATSSVKARTRWILGLLAVSLILPMVFFFNWVGSRASPGPGGAAGELFGHPVSWETFQNEHEQLRRTLRSRLGQLPDGLEPFLQQQTWDRLMLLEDAKRKARVSDAEVARFIATLPSFQENGRFVPELYFRFVRASGLSPQTFEARLRDDLRIQKLVDSVTAHVHLTDEEVRAAYARDHERLRAAVLVIDPTAFEPAARQALTEETLHAYYAVHHDQFRLPLQRTIEYIGLSRADALAEQSPPTEEILKTYYDEHQDELKNAEDSVPVPPFDSVREAIRRRWLEERAAQRLTNLALDVQDDADAELRLEEIAASRGLSVRTAGPIEPLSPAKPPQGFPASLVRDAFQTPLGHLSRALQVPEGVFVLRPIEETPARVATFEESKAAVERQVVQELARQAAKARAGQLRDALLAKQKAGLRFEEACVSLGLEVLHPEPFSRQDPISPLGDVPRVADALFALKPGEVSDVLETPKALVIAFVEERLPIDEAQFTQDQESFRKDLLASKQQEHLAAWLTELRSQAHLKSLLEASRSPFSAPDPS